MLTSKLNSKVYFALRKIKSQNVSSQTGAVLAPDIGPGPLPASAYCKFPRLNTHFHTVTGTQRHTLSLTQLEPLDTQSVSLSLSPSPHTLYTGAGTQ